MAQQTFNLPYREEPYQVTATRKFYHPQTKTISINPTTPNPSLSFELVRKTGDWIYYEDSEVLPYGRTVVEDNNVEPEDSYISQPGVDGLREFSEEREWIDGEWTGEVRNVTETITQPVNEIYVQGTAVVTYKDDVFRTEVIPYTTEEYNSNDYFIGEEVVTQQGVNGLRTIYRLQKYVNGVATGEFIGEDNGVEITHPVTHRIAIGTKPLEVTIETTLTSSSFSHTSAIMLFNYFPELVGKDVVRIELNGMVATGTWRALGQPSMYVSFSPNAGAVFGTTFATIPSGTPLYLTYQP